MARIMRRTRKKNLKVILRLIYFVIAIELLALSFLTIQSNPTIMNTITLATTVKPETFTELYFEDHLKLPTTLVPNKEYSFKFTIHNLENKEMNYKYQVYVEDANQKFLLDNDSVVIKKDESKTIPETLHLPGLNTKAKVVINLTNKNQQIDYWIEGGKSN
jgi:hypothetical protein